MRNLLFMFTFLAACANPEWETAHPDRPRRDGSDSPDYPDAWDDDSDDGSDDRSHEDDEGDDEAGDRDSREEAYPEECDGKDNDLDGEIDEDFEDTDGDGLADCVDVEECDGEDNDGNGLIDEGFDADHNGIADCLQSTYDVSLHITVDDIWDGTIDGEPIEAGGGWSHVDTFEWELSSGVHVITVHGEDLGEAITAFIASVEIDGEPTFVTGDGSWAMRVGGPELGWLSPDFADDHWATPVSCADTSPWGDWSGLPLEQGAEWVWFDSAGDCRDPSSWREAWFRLVFELP